jgi:hypothetical protein
MRQESNDDTLAEEKPEDALVHNSYNYAEQIFSCKKNITKQYHKILPLPSQNQKHKQP